MAETFSDETLMAFADGVLDDVTAHRVAEAADADETTAARIALFRGSAKVLERAAEAERATPAPDALIARVRARLDAAGDAEPPRVRPQPGHLARLSVAWPTALAASLALAVGLGAGWVLSTTGGTGTPVALDASWTARAGLAAPLSRLQAGEKARTEAGTLTLIASFRDASGALCREFELMAASAGHVAVACREADGWSLRFAAAVGGGPGGYAPASSHEALDAYLAAIGAGAPLDPAAEAAALSGRAE